MVRRRLRQRTVTTWTTRAEVWASFKLLSKPTERYIRKARKVAVVRLGQFGIIRPEVDFDERWRIIEVDGLARTWDVVGIGKGQSGADWKITVKA